MPPTVHCGRHQRLPLSTFRTLPFEFHRSPRTPLLLRLPAFFKPSLSSFDVRCRGCYRWCDRLSPLVCICLRQAKQLPRLDVRAPPTLAGRELTRRAPGEPDLTLAGRWHVPGMLPAPESALLRPGWTLPHIPVPLTWRRRQRRDPHALCFADCILDTQLYTLHRAGTTRLLQPKVFQVLQYLVAHRTTW